MMHASSSKHKGLLAWAASLHLPALLATWHSTQEQLTPKATLVIDQRLICSFAVAIVQAHRIAEFHDRNAWAAHQMVGFATALALVQS